MLNSGKGIIESFHSGIQDVFDTSQVELESKENFRKYCFGKKSILYKKINNIIKRKNDRGFYYAYNKLENFKAIIQKNNSEFNMKNIKVLSKNVKSIFSEKDEYASELKQCLKQCNGIANEWANDLENKAKKCLGIMPKNKGKSNKEQLSQYVKKILESEKYPHYDKDKKLSQNIKSFKVL